MPGHKTLHRDEQAAQPLKRELVTILKIIGEAAEEERAQAGSRVSTPTAGLPKTAAYLGQRAAPPSSSRPVSVKTPRNPALPMPSNGLSVPLMASSKGGAGSQEPFIVRAKLVARPLPHRAAALGRRAKELDAPQGFMSELHVVFAFLGRSFAIPELAAGIEKLVAFCRRMPGALVRAFRDESPRPVRLQTIPRKI